MSTTSRIARSMSSCKVAVIAVRILEEADFFSQPLGIESPAFGVGGVVLVLTEGRKLREFLGDRNLHVMAGNAFVVGGGFIIEQ